MKIIKHPYKDIINRKLSDKIAEANSICPFCGENRKFNFFEWCKSSSIQKKYGIEERTFGNLRYGHQKPWYKHLFEKPQYWKTLRFKCHMCCGEWESDEFPFYE